MSMETERTSAPEQQHQEQPGAPAPAPDTQEQAPQEEQPAEAKTPAAPQRAPLYVEPCVGQKVKIFVPARKDARGKPIQVIRPGVPRRAYQTGEVVRWDDHFVFLRQEGAVLATEIVEK
jgi:hypothetical protein